MNEDKKQRLEAKGWTVGSTAEFLGLTPEEQKYIDIKLALGRSLKDRRAKNQLRQVDVANARNTSQSRIAKIEAGDETVTIDSQIQTLLSIGASTSELAETIKSAC